MVVSRPFNVYAKGARKNATIYRRFAIAFSLTHIWPSLSQKHRSSSPSCDAPIPAIITIFSDAALPNGRHVCAVAVRRANSELPPLSLDHASKYGMARSDVPIDIFCARALTSWIHM